MQDTTFFYISLAPLSKPIGDAKLLEATQLVAYLDLFEAHRLQKLSLATGLWEGANYVITKTCLT